MKHLFSLYPSEVKYGILNDLIYKEFIEKKSTEDERLKCIYDAVDIIYDKRLKNSDKELKALLGIKDENTKEDKEENKVENKVENIEENKEENKEENIEENKEKNNLEKDYSLIYDFLSDYRVDDKQINSFRIRALMTLWKYVEEQYRIFCLNDNDRGTTLILYQLVRGNICIRISEIYYEDYDIEESDMWGNKAIEILWHGKNLADNYRDSLKANPQNLEEENLYLRIIKLNLAKYYRDYAGKNRRSDFDAALDELEHVKKRVEEEINRIGNEYKRQYTLIWLDASLNIARILREKYQLEPALGKVRDMFILLENKLQGDQSTYEGFPEILYAAKQLIKKDISSSSEDNIKENSFKNLEDLYPYDVKRYFLLTLLELGRIQRYLHSDDNYSNAIYIAFIADQLSMNMDKNASSGHNIDALNLISSSLRKYIKFKNEKEKINELLDDITIAIDTVHQSVIIDDGIYKDIASVPSLVKKLCEYADEGHLNSKIEVIKWYCLYLQYSELLNSGKKEVEGSEKVQSFFDNVVKNKSHNKKKSKKQNKKQNLQLRFLQGIVHFRKEEYQKAIDILEELIAPENKFTQYIRLGTIGLKARYTLANCYMSLAKFSKAEVILKALHDSLEVARKSREGQQGGFDADKEPRVEIDLAYCYMQRGAYKDASAIYDELYKKDKNTFDFDLKKVKRERCIMGLNNYAACSIFSINEKTNIFVEESNEESKSNIINNEELTSIKDKIETARRIFDYMDVAYDPDRDDPETNLLKGYYTLCVGIKPQKSEIDSNQVEKCRNITTCTEDRDKAIIMAHDYFRKACRFETGFTERYVLRREDMTRNEARCRNEVERVSAYIINLIKIYYLQEKHVYTNVDFDSISPQQNLQRLILGFPTNYEISLKAAISLAEWLLTYETKYKKEKEELIKQMFRSFSYVTIYEERGARVFNLLRNNGNFRFFTADDRGKFLALLLTMYKPIKAIKEECCFNLKDKETIPHLVHYTSIDNLKKIFDNSSATCFRINNCGYMNDVFEGNTLLNCIKLVAQEGGEDVPLEYYEFIKKYFPQIDRSHEDMLPSGSDVYIGSLSVKEDSFPLWSIYADKECGCNIEFGDGFFGINGTPYFPKALRDYMLSQYTDKDYPLYIVQYIGSKYTELYNKYFASHKLEDVNLEIEDAEGHTQNCGTRAIKYRHLFRLLQQIYNRWTELDKFLSDERFEGAISASKEVIHAFAADRINEIRFLFKDADYEFEGEVRIVYTDYTDHSIANTFTVPNVPRVYVDIDREIKEVSVRLGSRIEDATVDKYVTWLKHIKLVKNVDLSKRNRYTHQTNVKDLLSTEAAK